MAVLAHKKDISIAIHRDKNHGAAMLKNLKPGFMAVWCFERVPADFECTSL
jgi:hypothetical protein